MEFHVVGTHPLAVHEVEDNFRVIKSAVSQLRQNLVEAEMDFHRRPLSNAEDADDDMADDGGTGAHAASAGEIYQSGRYSLVEVLQGGFFFRACSSIRT